MSCNTQHLKVGIGGIIAEIPVPINPQLWRHVKHPGGPGEGHFVSRTVGKPVLVHLPASPAVVSLSYVSWSTCNFPGTYPIFWGVSTVRKVQGHHHFGHFLCLWFLFSLHTCTSSELWTVPSESLKRNEAMAGMRQWVPCAFTFGWLDGHKTHISVSFRTSGSAFFLSFEREFAGSAK